MAKSKFLTGQDALNAIFKEAIPLFANKGFSGVSIRNVATAVGVSISTIYHHFPDKKALYLGSIEAAFKDKAEVLEEILKPEGTSEEQLSRFIYRFTKMMAEDKNFRLLLQRELLEADASRLAVLANHVFLVQFENLLKMAGRISPNSDSHMMAISIFSLVLYHLEASPIRQYLPGGRPEHDEPEFIANHVFNLLINGVFGC